MPQTEATEAPVDRRTGAPVTEEAPTARARWWTELPLILLVYGAYSAGRLLARGDTAHAVDHGLAILRFEKALWLNAEHPLNRLFTREPWIGIPADFWYASLHYLVTPAILVWLFRSRAVRYRAARTWLLTSTFIGLIGFTLLPTCPPRLLDPAHGFVDTMAQYSSWGWWGGEASAPRGLGGMTNQYAAMPSLHVGWALWCGVILWRLGSGSRLVRTAAVAYPLITTIVVMGTANHYFLDAAAGAAVMGVGLLLTPLVLRIADRCRAALGLAAAGTAAGDRSGGVGGRRAEVPVTPATTASRGAGSPIVSGECQTSPGERIPRQRIIEPEPGAVPAEAEDGAAAPAR
ncbi:phosphatase PAP2 family protein [Streptomyces sp. NPDC057438]|uniref:phosphatase PAP2 family protein n=1 Tax=Streptomyces sp. NPDC057438 TaxID=3346133 RepID=UPI0036B2AFC1